MATSGVYLHGRCSHSRRHSQASGSAAAAPCSAIVTSLSRNLQRGHRQGQAGWNGESSPRSSDAPVSQTA